MAQNLYNPRVLLGNWNEDLFLEEDLLKDFLEKRDKGQLLIQRSRRLKETLLRPTKLSVSADGYIHFGDQVLLVNPSYEEKEADLFLRGDLSLCMTPDEIQAYLAHGLEVPCGLSVAQTRTPLGRNTFCVLSTDEDAPMPGNVLRYGQDFCLGTTGGCEGRMLFLSSDHRTLQQSTPRSWLQAVSLEKQPSFLSWWQATWPDPNMRLEYEGTPVLANTRLVLSHRHTNRALAVHRHLPLRTYFGKEAEVAAHTHLDTHKVEKPRNHWLLVTGNPRDAGSTMLDLSPPPAQVPETT